MLILALIVSLSLILYLVKKKVNLGAAIISGGVVLALLSGLSPGRVAVIIIEALLERGTIELVASVFLMVVLSNMMQEYGVMRKMVEYLKKIFGSTKVLLFVIPSLLSTFTATGSAIVAAPVIDSLGDKAGITNSRKAAINLYLRHAWYFVMPISVGLVNAAYLAGISLWELIRVQAPIALCCLVASYLVYIAPIADDKKEVNHDNEIRESRKEILAKALLYTAPLLLCVALVIWFPFYLALVIGCLFTYLIRVERPDLKTVLLKKYKSYNLVIAAAGIMIFKNIIENIPSLGSLIEQFIGLGVPLWLVFIILPAGLGYFTGSTHVVTGMLYPLLLPLVPKNQLVSTAMIIYTAGYTAYFISPVHLCQVLTNEFFSVSTQELYGEYRITVPVMFLSGIITYLVIR